MTLPCRLALLNCFIAVVPLASPRLTRAQEPESPQEIRPRASMASAAPNSKTTPRTTGHRFWDRENDLFFAGVAASRALDYSSTLNMRRRGRQEILLTNDVVDNHPVFAVVEAAGTGASVGVSWLFHRYGHHKLERWTSIMHIGLTTSGAIRNYSLKTRSTRPMRLSR